MTLFLKSDTTDTRTANPSETNNTSTSTSTSNQLPITRTLDELMASSQEVQDVELEFLCGILNDCGMHSGEIHSVLERFENIILPSISEDPTSPTSSSSSSGGIPNRNTSTNTNSRSSSSSSSSSAFGGMAVVKNYVDAGM